MPARTAESRRGGAPAPAAGAPRESRSTRRRRETRGRLLAAGARLLRARGVEGVTVQDVTEAADVGLGTFYLHFGGKSELVAAVIAGLVEAHDAEVRARVSHLGDPAAELAGALRLTIPRIARDPLWTWYVLRSGVPMQRLREAFGADATRDVLRGVEAGRFRVSDLATFAGFLAGAVVGVVADLEAGLVGPGAEEAAAELVLRTLGVEPEEAARLARLPLGPGD